ncbi:hypothetical protein Glove_144g81 [Diversispora epigaea]|uniref:Stretch-activated cation channel Mid1 n=1 Tax=Diversispora epigaea TaxID=1348612 RepID=A0A397IUA0_9GLOM|nr:hypothetical protein Glove_144g81 [Diversispora epigaea]
MQKYKKSYKWILFFSFIIFYFFIIIIKGEILSRDVTIQLIDSKIQNGSLSSASNSNIHFMYNYSSSTIQKRGLGGFIMKRATATTIPTKTTLNTINTKTTGRVNSVSSNLFSPRPSIPINIIDDDDYIYISVTICKLPSLDNNNNNNNNNKVDAKLKVYVSLDPSESEPRPNSPLSSEYVIHNGFLSFKIKSSAISSSSSSSSTSSSSTNKIIYFGLFSPNQTGVTGNYNYEIGVSTNGYLHKIPSIIQSLVLEDTDNSTALFRIDDENINLSSSFLTYIVDSNSVIDLYNSLCAFQSNTPENINITYNETTRGFIYPDKGKKVSISINNLKNGTNYTALVINNNIDNNNDNTTDNYNNIDPIFLHTKSQLNCRLVSNLTFCNRVAYSVPANPSHPVSTIIKFYDGLAEKYFKNFTLTLSQFSCNKTHYSLVRNCNDCLESYKNWICAMTVPRCGDEDSDDDSSIIGGIPRNANQSRIPDIDKVMVPGAYIEIPPCINLCYNTTQSCPSNLNFNCPPINIENINDNLNIGNNINYLLLFSSYGIMNSQQKGSISNVTCNPMGSDWIKTNSVNYSNNNLILFYWWKWVVGIIGIIEIIFQFGILL